MKNFDLVNYLKNNSLINEVKAVGTGYLEIKLTPEDEYGDDRDREKIIIPKYSYRLDKDSIDFLQSKETVIPEEEGFFPYLYAVLEEYLERSKREDLTKLSVRNQLVQDLINDLYLYIEANGVTSLGDTSPRDGVYDIFEKFLDKIFPDLSEDWSEYFERGAGIDALENNDSEYFINTWFGGDNENDDINEIKAIAPSKYQLLKGLVLKNFEDVAFEDGIDEELFDINRIKNNLSLAKSLNDIEEIFYLEYDSVGYDIPSITDGWVDLLKDFIEKS